jgi:hypothetical protein
MDQRVAITYRVNRKPADTEDPLDNVTAAASRSLIS